MPTFTEVLNLRKPEENDYYNEQTEQTENWQKIDDYAKQTNNDKLDKGTYSGDAGKLKEDIDEKMSKYQTRYDIRDYDDLLVDGFYILYGSSKGIANSPYKDAALVQVWIYEGLVYQRAVSPYDQNVNFVRCFKVGDKNVMWTTSCPYSVGDIYHTTKNEHPAVIWPFTTWEKIEGRFLLATSGSNASGQTGGSNTKTIAQTNLPNVKLQVDSFNLGRGTQEITGQIDYDRTPVVSASGAFVATSSAQQKAHGGTTDYMFYDRTDFAASRTWTGMSTSASPYTSALGSGALLDITPSYYTVHIWKRLT